MLVAPCCRPRHHHHHHHHTHTNADDRSLVVLLRSVQSIILLILIHRTINRALSLSHIPSTSSSHSFVQMARTRRKLTRSLSHPFIHSFARIHRSMCPSLARSLVSSLTHLIVRCSCPSDLDRFVCLFRALTRSLDHSFICSSLMPSLAHSIDRSFLLIVRPSFVRSCAMYFVARSLNQSLARSSLVHSLSRSFTQLCFVSFLCFLFVSC
jgi:hypothetical protein